MQDRQRRIIIRSDNPNTVLSLFATHWGEVDWILPVLYKLKATHPDWRIIPVFSPSWNPFNSGRSSNSTLYTMLHRIADDIVYFDPESFVIPGVSDPAQVKLIFKDIFTYEMYPPFERIHAAFPHAKTVAHHHGIDLAIPQRFNFTRNFNWWEEHHAIHDLYLATHQLGIPRLLDKIFTARPCVTGFPRFDQDWIDKLCSQPEFLESREKKMAGSKKRVFQFIIRAAKEHHSPDALLGDFPLEIFDYVVRSTADVILKDPDNFLLIKSHPYLDNSHVEPYFAKYPCEQWMITPLHVMQLASLCDMTISVHSGTILDCLAVGKPVIQFHPQTRLSYDLNVDRCGSLHSQFNLLGFSQPVRTKDELSERIHEYFNAPASHEIWQKQQQCFNDYYPRDISAAEKIVKVVQNLVKGRNLQDEGLPHIQSAGSPVSGDRQIFLNRADHTLHLGLKRLKASAMPVSSILLQELCDFFDTKNFICTGTFNIHLVNEASKIFKQVHVIESGSDLYQPLQFDLLSGQQNLNIHTSARQLSLLLPTIKGNSLFMLGSHDSAGLTFRTKTNTPVIEELKAIRDAGIKDAVILLDQVRFFSPQRLDVFEARHSRAYPSVKQSFDLIHEINGNYQFAVLGDIAMAWLPEDRVTVSKAVQACTLSRMYDGSDISAGQTLDADYYLAFELSDEEKYSIQSLHRDFASFEDSDAAHYRYWNGLTLIGERRYEEAGYEMIQAVDLGIDPWQIWLFLQYTASKSDHARMLRNLAVSLFQNYQDRFIDPPQHFETISKNAHNITRTQMNYEFIHKIENDARILEIGTNMASQLSILHKMGFYDLSGIALFDLYPEKVPGRQDRGALEQYVLNSEQDKNISIGLSYGAFSKIPFPDNSFDLIFSSISLTHFSPSNVIDIMKEIYRCTIKYIWGFEYYSDNITEINVFGKRRWKADFMKQYLELFPSLTVIKEKKYTYQRNNNLNSMFLLRK